MLSNRVRRWLERTFWYVHPTVTLLANAPAETCLQLLQQDAKPSTKRLHLQELFMGGRRYKIEPRRDGFLMFTNSKDYWRYTESMVQIRRRTRSSARLIAAFVPIGDDYTRIELKSHIRLGYLLDVLFIPTFMTSIVVFMPWAWWIIVLNVVLMFGLSFVYHYYNAAYQANEMIFFVEKVLKDKLVTSLPTLEAENLDVLRFNEDFEQEWERFYNAHRKDDR